MHLWVIRALKLCVPEIGNSDIGHACPSSCRAAHVEKPCRASLMLFGIVLPALQCIAYAIYITPVFFMWEKLIGTHYKPNWVRLPSRLPVGKQLINVLLWKLSNCMTLEIPAFGSADTECMTGGAAVLDQQQSPIL